MQYLCCAWRLASTQSEAREQILLLPPLDVAVAASVSKNKMTSGEEELLQECKSESLSEEGLHQIIERQGWTSKTERMGTVDCLYIMHVEGIH